MQLKYFLMVLMWAFALNAQAQYLSLESLISLRGQDVESVHSVLATKGWRFSSANAETSGRYSVAIWSYGQSLYSERARAFFRLFVADGYLNKASFQTSSKEHYLLIKNRIATNKMMKVGSSVKDGYIATTYEGANYYVTISIGTDDMSQAPVYNFMVEKKGGRMMPIDSGEQEEDAGYNTTEDEEADAEADLSESTEAFVEHSVDTNSLYTQLADNASSYAPRAQDIVQEDVIRESCTLYTRPWDSSRETLTLEEGNTIQVISKLLDEDHSYYFVYANGRYGYVKFSTLRSNEGLL